ncbi:hypothetical protein AB1Y20_020586 [Prymnesium parvum]|uniref:Protein xylosyltransferase n=1 Tax=Prymnesium parvum TaxID=97485 RepID=A0AB34JXB9_PRYPA
MLLPVPAARPLRYLHVSVTTMCTRSPRRDLALLLDTVVNYSLIPETRRVNVTLTTDNSSCLAPLVHALPRDSSSVNFVYNIVEVRRTASQLHNFLITHRHFEDWDEFLRLPEVERPDVLIYAEDDTILSAEALVAWRDDSLLFDKAGLTSNGFTRDFVRVIHTTTGLTRVADVKDAFKLNRSSHPGCKSSWCTSKDEAVCVYHPLVQLRTASGRRAFLTPSVSYNAITVSTPQQRVPFLKWRKGRSSYGRYQVREFAANGHQFNLGNASCTTLCASPNFWPHGENNERNERQRLETVRALVPVFFQEREHRWAVDPSAFVLHSSCNEKILRHVRTGKLPTTSAALCR